MSIKNQVLAVLGMTRMGRWTCDGSSELGGCCGEEFAPSVLLQRAVWGGGWVAVGGRVRSVERRELFQQLELCGKYSI